MSEYYPIVKISPIVASRLPIKTAPFWRSYQKKFPYVTLFSIGIIITLFFSSFPTILTWAVVIILLLGLELYLWGLLFASQKFAPFTYLQPISSSTAQKGVSEKFFFEHLQSVFGEEAVRWGGTYRVPNWEEKYWYSSDIELIWQDLAIQIEIDEPYIGTSKKPHHCCDLDLDRQRDLFFLESNWIVVRYSERQVVEYPERCCSHLVRLLVKLQAANPFFTDEELPLDPCWSKADSFILAAKDYRLTYLKAAGLWQKKK